MSERPPDSADGSTADANIPAGTREALIPGTRVGRYLLLEQLGLGGMGVVYKAYDPQLDRRIALKLLRFVDREGGAHRERLLREAQALARLSHPNVVAVHDVGISGDELFIAMEFVEGTTLGQWLAARKRTHREILDLFLAAGEGVQAAHRAGVVHRDFKPDNVMVGQDGRIRVLDFGVARATHADEGAPASPVSDGAAAAGERSPNMLASPLTHAGAVVGTPRFMAPEQHLGKIADEAADQFSFCVSLFAALYGVFPFDSKGSVIRGEISAAPEEATVPRWLRAVIVRGLAPQPRDRFPSMAALLSALRADPRQARLRRLRVALAVFAIGAVVAAATAGGLELKARRAATEQAQLSHQFGLEVERIAAISRYSASLPLHDTRRERSAISERMAQLTERMRSLGPLAAGPGHEALGRGYLALERDDEARRELDAAYATGYRSPELSYALGLVYGKLYERALADLQKTKDQNLDAARRDELARRYREPALRYLKQAEIHNGQPLGGVDAPEYVEGLIALYERRFTDALALAHRTADRVLWLYESRALEGDIHLTAGKERFLDGDVEGAVAELARAGDGYGAAVDVARSGSAAYLGDCRRLVELVRIARFRDQTPEATVKRAVSACNAAATTRPDDARPLAALAEAWQELGAYQVYHSLDAAPAEEEAIRLGKQALSVDSRYVRALSVIGRAYEYLGYYRNLKRDDPRPFLTQAADYARQALQVDANFSEAFRIASQAYWQRGEYEGNHGLDPRRWFHAAIEQAKHAIEKSPRDFDAWNTLGVTESYLGEWEMGHGYDPTEAFARAVEAYGKVMEVSPELDMGFVNQCGVYAFWGEFARQRGSDPRPILEQGASACNQAIRLDPNFFGAYTSLGLSYKILATWQLEHAIDPGGTLDRARATIGRALQLSSDDVESLNFLCEARIVEARAAEERGRDPSVALNAAEAVARRALALSDGKAADTLRVLAEIHRWRAEWRARRKLEVESDVRPGLTLVARAVAQDPRSALAAATEGALQLVAARASARTDQRAAAAEHARAALARALTLNANLEREYRPLQAEASRLAAP